MAEGWHSAETETGPAAAPPPIAFEAIQALPGFCQLVRRSPTLDGNLPLRAAQHCSPVFEGNAAGFQICLEQPITLRRDRGQLRADLTPPAFKQTQEQIRDAIEELVKAGLLARHGYWHKLFARDAIPFRGARALLWTGFLVKPAEGVCLRVGPAYNRRSRIQVIEHAIADRSGFTPLVVDIDGRRLGREPRWLDDEIGCVLAVAPHARMSLEAIRRAPELVREFEAFFDAHYFETKKEKPTGKYRRLVRGLPEPADQAAGAAADTKVFYAGPAAHTVSTLARFFGPTGVSAAAPAGVSLPVCTVKSVASLEAVWDGQAFTHENKSMAAELRALARDWRRAGGNPLSDAYEFLAGHFIGPGRDEPYWLLQPWVFAVTPAGCSTCIDGADVAGADGMRGILRTDQFHSIAMVWRMYTPGRLSVRRGATLMRFYPIPRRLQEAHMSIGGEVI